MRIDWSGGGCWWWVHPKGSAASSDSASAPRERTWRSHRAARPHARTRRRKPKGPRSDSPATSPNEADCEQAVEHAVTDLGGLDDVVYSAGAISLVALDVADADWWRRTFDTNVMGAALITKYALPHLKQAAGSMIYLSSVSSIGPAWPGVGVYTATKAALNRMVETWRVEHPEVGFTRIFVGPTADAGTGTNFDMSAFEHMGRWAALGIASGAMDTPKAISEAVELVLQERLARRRHHGRTEGSAAPVGRSRRCHTRIGKLVNDEAVTEDGYLTTVERVIPAPPERIFDLLADPSRHREIDGSGSVRDAKTGSQRLALGSTFTMSMKMGTRTRPSATSSSTRRTDVSRGRRTRRSRGSSGSAAGASALRARAGRRWHPRARDVGHHP